MRYITRQHTASYLLSILLVSALESVYGAEDWVMPRTEFGHPDLQGVWYYGSGTDFERPEHLGHQQVYTQAQAVAVLESLQAVDAAKTEIRDPNRGAPAAGVPIAQEADHEFATTRVNLVQINGEYRTSQIVSPANGRWPYRGGGMDIFERWQSQGFGAYDRLVLQCQHADHSD